MIREMRSEDRDRVMEIYARAIALGQSAFRPDCPSYEIWNASYSQNCRFVYVLDNIVVGWIAVHPVSASPWYSGVVEVSVYVDEAYRGRGIGTALLTKLCNESESFGYWCLYSSIFSANKASIALHKKCGFREIGYREKLAKDRFGVWQDTTLMERRSKTIF